MVHLYCGEGKGKTTAAMGLALRMAGRGRAVVIAQFLKGADSGERLALAQVPGVRLLEVPERVKFSFQLTPAEREAERTRNTRLLALARKAAPSCDLLVLDEVCAAVNTGLLPLEDVLDCLDSLSCEVVLTGRDPAPELRDRADYLTEMRKVRHPFDRGVCARTGIERGRRGRSSETASEAGLGRTSGRALQLLPGLPLVVGRKTEAPGPVIYLNVSPYPYHAVFHELTLPSLMLGPV